MAKVSLAAANVMYDGAKVLDETYSSTDVLRSKVALNPSLRDWATIHCNSSHAGTLEIFDVDEDGNYLLITTIAITADTLSSYSHGYTTYGIYCKFTPDGGASSDTVIVRVYFSGRGVTS